MPKQKLTNAFVAKAKPDPRAEANATFYWDAALGNFALAVAPSGHKTFVIQYRSHHVSRRLKIGQADRLVVEEARKIARKFLSQVDHGQDPLLERRRQRDAETNTFRAVAQRYLERKGEKFRSLALLRSTIERLLYPTLGSLPVADIRRSHITKMMDRVEDENGPTAADSALAALSRVLNWYATTTDDYRSPIVRGMGRATDRKPRERVLSDDELRKVWTAAESFRAPWGAYVKFLLLTGCRRNEAARMTWAEATNGTWVIPAARHKSKQDALVPLSKAAQQVLNGQPRIEGKPWPFYAGGPTAPVNFTDFKRAFDSACGVSGWTLHDLRRTARSLLSRAGVSADTAERCVTHVIGGIRGVYDRHRYESEMQVAFERLASLIETIVNPQDNVIAIPARGR
jgi:integrase